MSSAGRLLRQLGFSDQKPLYRAYQQNPEAVKRWMDVDFPKIKKEAEKIGAAISTRGHMRFMVVRETVDADRICDFLKRLTHHAENPIFLILDRHPAHRSGKVKECILSVFYLPSYSLERMPPLTGQSPPAIKPARQ